jgi:2-oxo-4-hydroxy-4-carboxy-5-ureidoimidazoline decarboxylase
MAEPHAVLGVLSREEARVVLQRCCGSSRWVERMLDRRPFASTPELVGAAREVWGGLSADDYLEAFAQHPAIGEDAGAIAAKFPDTAEHAGREQSSVREAGRAVLEALREGNIAYRERFGFLFIVCATGKSAQEMLSLLRARLGNDPDTELRIAASEQAKITELRLERLAT